MSKCCDPGSNSLVEIENSAQIIKAISESNRLRALCVLSKEEICVCELAKKLDISRNLLSFHLKNLLEAGILYKQKKGNKIYFNIKPEWKDKIEHLFTFIGIN